MTWILAAPGATIIAVSPEWQYAYRLPVIAWLRWHDGSLRPFAHISMPWEFRFALFVPDGLCGDDGFTYPDPNAWLASATAPGREPIKLREYAPPVPATVEGDHDGD